MEIEHKIKDIVYIVDTNNEESVPLILKGAINKIIISIDNSVLYVLFDVVAVDPMYKYINFEDGVYVSPSRIFNHLGNAMKYVLTYINNQHENDISQFESQCERIKEANGDRSTAK